MSGVFIHLYLDEDVSHLVADLIRSRHYSVTTTLEAGNVARSDEHQLAYAADHQMTLLTHNRRDFDLLAKKYAGLGKHHAGVIIAVRRRESELARRLLVILDRFAMDEMTDQVLYI